MSNLARSFSAWDLPEQFVLGATPPTPDSWVSSRTRGLTLARHPTLPQVDLTDGAGQQVGWLLGYPIHASTLVRDGETVPLPAAEQSGVEELLQDLGGRFVLICTVPEPRVYPDACGSLSAVYAPDQGLVASTSNLIPQSTGTAERTGLVKEMAIPHSRAMYPLGMTSRQNVDRILPNHYLDMDDWSLHRFWPTSEIHSEIALETAAVRVGTVVRDQILATMRVWECYLPLTAGYDSRMLLACARDRAEALACYTLDIGDRQASLDVRAARRLAGRFGLSYRPVPRIPARQRDLDEWVWRSAAGTGELRGWQTFSSLRQLDPSRVHLMGNVGEVARGFYWRQEDTRDTELTPERLVAHCQAPRTPATHQRAAHWLDTTPALDTLKLLDLFYIEQRLGCWAGIWAYGEYGGPGFVQFPMAHRRVISSMMRLPDHHRRSGKLPEAVIRRFWPELLDLPFNEEIGLRKYVRDVGSLVAGGQRRIARAIRRLVG